MYVLNKYKDRNKVYSAAQPSKIPPFKYRADPRAQRALNEIAAVSEVQNKIAYINNFIGGTGRYSLQFETEDEITREEKWLKEEREKQQRQWEQQEQLLQQRFARDMDADTERDEKNNEK